MTTVDVSIWPFFALIPQREFRGFRPVIANYERAGESMFLTFQERIRRARGARIEQSPVAIREGARFSSGHTLPEVQPILWTADSYPLVTDLILDRLQSFTGWSTYPVNIVSQEKKPVPGYTGLAVTGRIGRVLPNLDHVDEHRERATYVGVRYDSASWDGSDIVWPVRGTGILVCQQLARALMDLQLTSTRLIPLDELRWDKATVDLMRQYRTAQFNTLSDDWLWEPAAPRLDRYAELARGSE